MKTNKQVRMELARKLEHFASLLEEAAEAEGCEEECLTHAADAAVDLVKAIETRMDVILGAEAEVNVEAASVM